MVAETPHTPEQDASGPAAAPTRAATGIEGLDAVLGGGLLRRRMYVIEGAAGAGKTTLALQFMLAGRAHHERGLWITTNETPDELLAAAHAHGWSLKGIDVHALSMADDIARAEQQQTLFRPSQVELDETMQAVLAALERVRPGRVVLDSLSILRDMADEPFAYRRQVLALKNALIARGCTALVTDELRAPPDMHLRTVAHGVIRLLQGVTAYGNERRQVEIVKMRAMPFRGGRHDYVIETGGLRVFPRLLPAPPAADARGAVLSTGLAPLDALLGGGLDGGAATLLLGAAGTGKSSVTMQCATAALQRGHSVAAYLFDERPPTWFQRADRLGVPLGTVKARAFRGLRRLADRLLLLATSEDPDFLSRSPVDIGQLLAAALQRWAPIDRRWRLEPTEPAVVTVGSLIAVICTVSPSSAPTRPCAGTEQSPSSFWKRRTMPSTSDANL